MNGCQIWPLRDPIPVCTDACVLSCIRTSPARVGPCSAFNSNKPRSMSRKAHMSPSTSTPLEITIGDPGGASLILMELLLRSPPCSVIPNSTHDRLPDGLLATRHLQEHKPTAGTRISTKHGTCPSWLMVILLS